MNEGRVLVGFCEHMAAEFRRSTEAVPPYHAKLRTTVIIRQASVLPGDFYKGDHCTNLLEI